MILQALLSYYEALAARGEISQPGYSLAKVSYALRIGWDGNLLGLVPMKRSETRGKKEVEVPREMEVPEQALRGNPIFSNFLCDHGGYFLGIDDKGKPERTLQCFAAARELHQTVLAEVTAPAAKAVLSFFMQWQPDGAAGHPKLQPYMEDILAGANLVFSLPNASFAHDDPEVKEAWERYKNSQEAGVRMQCLVTGKKDQPIAILHGKIKGVKDAQPAGASLVSFNARAYESYGRDEAQGLNAPVSEYAAFAYVTVLNRLIADTGHRQLLGDATVVYWADDGDPKYQDAVAAGLATGEDQAQLHDIMEKMAKGHMADMDGLRWDMPFYVLALSPNAARVSIRFFWRSSFGEVMDNMRAHYRRLEIIKPSFEKREYLTPYWLLKETVSPMSQNQDASPLLTGSVMRSIFVGTPYPAAFLQSVINRIRSERKVSRGKAAIVKAWLMHHGQANDSYKEVLTVSLNNQSTNRAYVLGRLFAVLEKTQEDANPGINATIKDRYFASACAAPGTVFPILLRLSNHHIAKAEYGKKLSREIGELMDKLQVEANPFPSQLSLEDQGIFVLGYYHQVQARYQKKAPAAGGHAGDIMDAEIIDTKEEA